MEVPFTSGDQPVLPPKVIDSDFAFPTSVTISSSGTERLSVPGVQDAQAPPEDKAEAG